MKELEEKKECWELFSVPEVNTYYFQERDGNGNITPSEEKGVQATFHCNKTGTQLNVYYPENEGFNHEFLSEVMMSILSVCHHCKGVSK